MEDNEFIKITEIKDDSNDTIKEKDKIEEKEVTEALKKVNIPPKVTNKRIDFDMKTMRRLETMLAVYRMDLDDNVNTSEVISYVVRKAIDSLFENDFKKKLEEL